MSVSWGRCKHTHTGAQFARNIVTWLLEKRMLVFLFFFLDGCFVITLICEDSFKSIVKATKTSVWFRYLLVDRKGKCEQKECGQVEESVVVCVSD